MSRGHIAVSVGDIESGQVTVLCLSIPICKMGGCGSSSSLTVLCEVPAACEGTELVSSILG